MKKLPIALFLLLVPTAAAAEDVNVTTYYPSPIGNYQRLQVDELGTQLPRLGSLQVTQDAGLHPGSEIAFIKEGGPRMGLGYGQNSDIFGFGPATVGDFQPTYLTIDNISTQAVRVGIGTRTPLDTLHVEQTGGSSVARFVRYGNDAIGSGLTLAFGRGLEVTSPTPIERGDDLGRVTFAGVLRNLSTAGSEIVGSATANWTAGSTPAALSFRTIPNGSRVSVERARITQDGALEFRGLTSAPAVSPAGTARIYFNPNWPIRKLMFSENARAYATLDSAPPSIVKVFQRPLVPATTSQAAPIYTVDTIPHGIIGPYDVYASVSSLGINKFTRAGYFDRQVKITNYNGVDGRITDSFVQITTQSYDQGATGGYSVTVIGVPR